MESDKREIEDLLKLREIYNQSRIDYYRFVIRTEDRMIFSRLGKIPDNWDNYTNKEGIQLTNSVKSRLSDIKKKKSWELKLQSLYVFFVTDIENMFLSVLQQIDVEENELNDSIDSISNLILELNDEFLNFKYLLLTLAKRSISDMYYILSAYSKFFMKKNFNYEDDIKSLLSEINIIFRKYIITNHGLEYFININNEIKPLFIKSTNEIGWRMNEFAVKDYFERTNHVVKISELNKIVRSAYEYKKNLLNYYLFLKFYYNENDGKLFRLNFVYDSLKVKLDENKINKDVFESYQIIRESFINYKNLFEKVGLNGFGSEKMSYYELIDFIYKLCKIIEFYYLRNMKYETLQLFRNDILFYVEKEILTINS